MEEDWIGIITPTKDGKYMMARATIEEDRNIESLKDAAIIVSDSEGKKEDLKYPFVLLQDIEILKQKLIEDLKDFLICNLRTMDDDIIMEYDTNIEQMVKLVNKRFGVK